MAPTATSPPYRARLELKLMESRLSVESITKVEMPSPITGRMTRPSGRRCSLRSRRMVLLPVRKRRIQKAPTAWLSTVAMAAPRTPMSSTKMRMGSRMMLMTAPMTVVSILILAKPWVVIKGFMPMTRRTQTEPRI